MKNNLPIIFAACCLSLSAGAETEITPSPEIYYGEAVRKLGASVSAGASAGELALALRPSPPPKDLAELAARWAVFSHAGFEVELEKLLLLLDKKWPLDEWYEKLFEMHGTSHAGFYSELAKDLAARERWRLLRMLLELRPQVTAGAVELHQHWALSGSAVDEETWLRQRLALTAGPVYDMQRYEGSPLYGRNVWVRELFELAGDGQRRDALVAEWQEKARQGDFLAVRDLIFAKQFTAAMAAEFEPQHAAQALMMGVALTNSAPEQALTLLDKALTLTFGVEEKKYIWQMGLSQQRGPDEGTPASFRRMVLWAKKSVYEHQKNAAAVAETERLLKESEPQRVRYQLTDSGAVTAVPESPQEKEIQRLCDLARNHQHDHQWREAFAAYEQALALIPMPEHDGRGGKWVDVTRDRDAVVSWAADDLKRAGDTAGAVKFLREQLAAMPPGVGERSVGKLCDLTKDQIAPEDEALLWRWLEGAGNWEDAPAVMQALTVRRSAEEQEAVWRRLRELAERGDLEKQSVCARQRKDVAWLEKLARADWSQSQWAWRKDGVMRALYDLYCEQGKWREAGEWLPSVYPPLRSERGLEEMAKLAALMVSNGDEAGALALWRRLLAYDLCATPYLPLPESASARRALLALHEELAARYPDSAGLAKSVGFLRKKL